METSIHPPSQGPRALYTTRSRQQHMSSWFDQCHSTRCFQPCSTGVLGKLTFYSAKTAVCSKAQRVAANVKKGSVTTDVSEAVFFCNTFPLLTQQTSDISTSRSWTEFASSQTSETGPKRLFVDKNINTSVIDPGSER